ncbi:hypothetical protein Q5P01_008643 [Channa striata]|uniref:Uncharacterized protein n=1 Tax=Channa striata TaxID=64152 RepID=A0AA88SWP2_CHASR|nr:hypothetical protein Q5P01_008643 [Channa striata]
MEQYLRIALWMFLLMGYLQARPTISSDLCFECLREVSCEQNVTFISPTNVKDKCYNAALKSFENGLFHAKKNCSDENARMDDTLHTLPTMKHYKTKHSPDANSTECKWENEASRKQFANFVNDFEDFIQRLLTNQA